MKDFSFCQRKKDDLNLLLFFFWWTRKKFGIKELNIEIMEIVLVFGTSKPYLLLMEERKGNSSTNSAEM